MDKTWTTLDSKNPMARLGHEYQRGVKSFIDFAKANAGDAAQIYCPCKVCLNSRRYDFDTMKFHILYKGMQASYTTWVYHGETIPPVNEVVELGHGDIDSDYKDWDEYPEMMQDHDMGTYTEAETVQGNTMRHFERMLDASQRPRYPGCSPDNTLLQTQKAVLPDSNLVPESVYATKKIQRDLGLGYEHIDGCENDCDLFWKENAGLDKCPQRLELGLSQSEVSSSPVAQQQLIENVLGKRVTRRQGCLSRGPASVSNSTTMATEMSSLRQQLAESQRVQEELRGQHEAQEELRRQQEESLKQLQDQAVRHASQIQMLLQQAGLGGSGSTGS